MKQFFIALISLISLHVNCKVYAATYLHLCQAPNKLLREKVRMNQLNGITFNLDRPANGGLASSYMLSKLPKELEKITRIEHPNMEQLESLDSQYEWCKKYAPGAATDSDTKTGWCEGEKGQGIGEVIIIPAEVGKQGLIFSGYGKSFDLHKQNSRPKSVKVFTFISDQTNIASEMEVGDWSFSKNLKLTNTMDCSLEPV